MNKIIILTAIFIFSLSLRLWGINAMGRTWDEHEYVEQGYKMIELIKKGDFNNSYFYTTYDHPPLVKYLYGLAAHLDVESFTPKGDPIFRYDFTYARILSAVIASLSIVLIVLIGWSIGTFFVGIAGGIILSMLPFYLGLSQLVTAEPFVMLTFSGAFYCYLLLLKKFSIKRLILTGIVTGIALQIKQSNALTFLLFFCMYFVNYKFEKKKNKSVKFFNKRFVAILYIFLISIGVFIFLWPSVLLHFSEIQSINHKLWDVRFSPKIWQITLSPPEVFFGRLMLTPVFYYFVYFFITIPVLVLIAFFSGVREVIIRKNRSFYFLLLWFLIPFIMSVYSWRQHGLRYIIEIYAPLALIAAIGLESVLRSFTKRTLFQYLYFFPILFYLLLILFYAKPYYLDYFNFLVGGTKGVYERRSFQLGWWGQGVGEASSYVKRHAPKGSRLGLAISPDHVAQEMPDLIVSQYKRNEEYDFILVNYYHILRDGFDDSQIRSKYKPIYEVKANGAILTTVYKK